MPNQASPLMPVLFIGHGTPMNGIEDNSFSREWRRVAQTLPPPKAILCVSAHWETWGTAVTAMEKPRTIHDFAGFPQELYAATYAAPGSPWLAEQTRLAIHDIPVGFDRDWGLDHGAWSVLKQMYPKADIPVVQLSLDYSQPASYHYNLGRQLLPLRNKGVLILGSGNLVHNLQLVSLPSGNFDDINQPFGLDWALEAQALFRKLIDEGQHTQLCDYPSLGKAARLAVPTPEHFLPMLYCLALQQPSEKITHFNDVAVAGSLTMTSLLIDQPVAS